MPATVHSYLVILTILGEIQDGQAQVWPVPFSHNWALCATLTFVCSSPTPWTKCSILLTQMSSMSHGSIKWWVSCPSLNVAKASQSQTTREAISDVCLHLLHWGLFTGLSLNGCPFKWQCPVNIPNIVCSWFLLRLSSSPVFSRVFNEIPYRAFVHEWTATTRVSYSYSPWSLTWQPLQIR